MEKKKKLIIFGNTNYARLVAHYLKQEYEICGFTVDKAYIEGNTFEDKPLIDFESIIDLYPPQEYNMFVAVGYSKRNKLREEIYKRVKNKGYSCINYIHPSCIVPHDIIIGENCILFENVVVQPFVQLANNIIIWSNATVCHDSRICDNVFIGSNACINGFVIVKNNVFLGANSTIRDHVQVEEETLVGCGVAINQNTEKKQVLKAMSPQ